MNLLLKQRIAQDFGRHNQHIGTRIVPHITSQQTKRYLRKFHPHVVQLLIGQGFNRRGIDNLLFLLMGVQDGKLGRQCFARPRMRRHEHMVARLNRLNGCLLKRTECHIRKIMGHGSRLNKDEYTYIVKHFVFKLFYRGYII